MAIQLMNLCDYGCGQQAKHQFKNGKVCCSSHSSICPQVQNKISKKILTHSNEIKIRNKKIHRGKIPWNKGKTGVYNKETIEKFKKVRKGKTYAEIFGESKAKKLKDDKKEIRLTIEKIKEKYPFFFKIEEMQYNPDIPKKEIQVHCKNHNCSNSKEKGGWFTPTKIQLYERIRNIEQHGLDNAFYYCCDECKNICPIYNLHSDPYQITNKPYTQDEYQIFRTHVLERDNYKCQYCGEQAEHVHHERPQKLEPFYSLDPDLAWSVCKKCHYIKGHTKGTKCSTGILSTVVCK